MATSLHGELENGSEWLYSDLYEKPWSEDDQSRIMSACEELIDEFFRRGGGWYGEGREKGSENE